MLRYRRWAVAVVVREEKGCGAIDRAFLWKGGGYWKTNKGLDGVSVQLIQNKYSPATHGQKDTVIAGMITDRHGEFSLENLPIFGNFRLKITAIGYKTYEQKVAFDLKGLRPVGGGGHLRVAPVRRRRSAATIG